MNADPGRISLWLDLARSNGTKCFICGRIAEQNGPGSGEIRPIRISGIELTQEVQVSHLSICVGKGIGNA
jgi:hypothetical protein